MSALRVLACANEAGNVRLAFNPTLIARADAHGAVYVAWDESKHPRHPKGSGDDGGEFAPKNEWGISKKLDFKPTNAQLKIEADNLEEYARKSLDSWILLGQSEKYQAVMDRVRRLRAAMAIRGLVARKLYLENYSQKQSDYAEVADRLDSLEASGLASMREVLLEIKAKLETQIRGAKDASGLRALVARMKPVRRPALRDAVLELMRRAWDAGSADARGEVTIIRKQAAARPKSSFIPRPALQWLRQKAFYISDILGDKILSDAKGVILNAIKTGRTTQDALIDLAVVLLPYLGDPAVVQDDEQLAPYRLETIIRTNTTEAYNHGRLTSFVDPDVLPFVDWVRYSAILDTRTTEVCRFLHMKLFKPGASALEELLPPNHFNCRSIVVPVVVGETVDMKDVITPAQIGKAKGLADAKLLTERGAWKKYVEGDAAE